MEKEPSVAVGTGEYAIERPVTIDVIQSKRMSNTREMLADLMAASALLHTYFEERRIPELLLHTIPCDGGNLSVTRTRGESKTDYTLSRETTRNDGNIHLFPLNKFFIQNILEGRARPSEEYDSRRLKIETVHRAKSGILPPEKIEERKFPDCPLPPHHQFTGKLIHRK